MIDEKTYQGVTNVGYNPTFHDKALSVETHVLDYSGDLVGKKIRINFLSRLRGERSFQDIRELSEQIAKDIEDARTVLVASQEA
jgi:riboflavin kinase/FMN adenylyltransferase